MPADEGLDTSRMTFSKRSLVGSKFRMYSGSLVTSTTRASIAALRAATPPAISWGIFNFILQKKGKFLMITGTLLLLTSLQIFGLVPGFLTQEFWRTYFLLFIVQHIPVIKLNNFSIGGDLLCAEQNKLKRTDKSHSFGRNGSSSDL